MSFVRTNLTESRKSLYTAALILLAAMMVVSYLWGTAFTCDDDLWTSTAWQRWGGGYSGLHAILHASWVQAVDQGRFYQLFAYTITQLSYMSGSIEVASGIRIGCVLLVLLGFILMLASLFRDLRIALYFAVLPIGLLETKYAYNPFHAYPLWFNLGIAFLFLAIAAFNEGQLRQSRVLSSIAIAFYCGSLLLYESFVLYVLLFYVIACLHSFSAAERLPRLLWNALASVSGFLVSILCYLTFYYLFATVHPPTYAGRVLSLGAPSAMLNTIFQFSISGLNFAPLFHPVLVWSIRAFCVAAVVFVVSFSTLRHHAFRLRQSHILIVLSCGVAAMVLPNVLYGFSERYRDWATNIGHFYLGSFYAAFGEALVLGTILITIMRWADRFRGRTFAAGALAAVLSFASYANMDETARFFRIHQNNRKAWKVVDAILSGDAGGLVGPTAVVFAPTLVHLPQLETGGVYDYWSYYFSNKLGFTVRVVGDATEYARLPQQLRSMPLFGMSWSYSTRLDETVATLGPIDMTRWHNELTSLPLSRSKVVTISDHVRITERGAIELSGVRVPPRA